MTDLITRLREAAGWRRAFNDPVHAALLEEAAGALEASGKDAARLDWFDKHADGVDLLLMWTVLIYNDGNRVEGATLRAAIDAAMEKANG